MQELKIFNNSEFGQVRTIVLDGEPWFCMVDICKSLDIGNVSQAKTRLKEDGVIINEVIDSIGRKQNTNFINESNMYKLVFQSRKESAERFSDWVTDEVLPTIRKTGGYLNNTDLFINTYFDDIPEEQKNLVRTCLVSIEEKQKKINNLQKENDLLSQKVLQWADRPLINSIVRAYAHSLNGDFRKAWTDFKKELLYQHSINLNSRITAYLNQTGKKTKPKTLDMIDDSELQKALSTVVALCRDNDVDISEIIEKKAS